MKTTTKKDLVFSPPLRDFNAARAHSAVTCLAGPNNSGKSLVLKWLKHIIGPGAYIVGTNRFYHVYQLDPSKRSHRNVEQFESDFRNHFDNDQHNFEQNFLDLNHIIANLNDAQRDALFGLCGDLIGGTFSLKRVVEDNDLSPRYVDMDGQNISVGSTGTRLLMTLLGLCFERRFHTLLIDEPELGLGPKLQRSLADFFFTDARRTALFPHLNRIFLATHSHLFLHRQDITSNFIVTKVGARIELTTVDSISKFHELQFNLLGNSLETLFFPSAIVVVEGKTDLEYLDRLIQLRFVGRRVAVVHGAGDVKAKVASLRQAFGELQKSPMRNRLFVVADSVHPRGLRDDLEKLGADPRNIVIWTRNGIEYFYPPGVLAEIFSCSESAVSELVIDGDRISVNGVTFTKNELKTEVLRRLTAQHGVPDELQQKLLDRLRDAIE